MNYGPLWRSWVIILWRKEKKREQFSHKPPDNYKIHHWFKHPLSSCKLRHSSQLHALAPRVKQNNVRNTYIGASYLTSLKRKHWTPCHLSRSPKVQFFVVYFIKVKSTCDKLCLGSSTKNIHHVWSHQQYVTFINVPKAPEVGFRLRT